MEGDSSLCRYTLEAGRVELTHPVGAAEAGLPNELNGLRATLFVADLKSGSSLLDGNVRSALRAGSYPVITLDVETVRALPRPGTLRADGELTVAGVKRAVSFDVRVDGAAKGGRLAGNLPIRLSDFGVQPPVVFGLIHARNEVVVRMDLTLGQPSSR